MFKTIPDVHVTKQSAIHGWSEEEIKWLDTCIEHYNKELNVSMKRFFYDEYSSTISDVGIANNSIYIPLKLSPNVLKFYIDWILLHEPMHQRQRTLLGINEESINSYLSSGGDISKIIHGIRDWESKYSIPPLKTLYSILPSEIKKIGILTALDLHADAKMFREGHKFIQSLSIDEILKGVTCQIKLFKQCIIHCIYEMMKIQHAKDISLTFHITNLPYLARFYACIKVINKLLETIDKHQIESLYIHLIDETSTFPNETIMIKVREWIKSNSSEKLNLKLENDYEAIVLSFIGSNNINLYNSVKVCYEELLLIVINRREHIKNLSTLVEALADDEDSLLRIRASDYLAEIGSYEALLSISNRLLIENDYNVIHSLLESLHSFGSKFPLVTLNALVNFQKKDRQNDPSIKIELIKLLGVILEFCTFHYDKVSAKDWQIISDRSFEILSPILNNVNENIVEENDLVNIAIDKIAFIGDHENVLIILLRLATLMPELFSKTVVSIAGCFTYAYMRVLRVYEANWGITHWSNENLDLIEKNNELKKTLESTSGYLSFFINSNQKEIRNATLKGYEELSIVMSKFSLEIKKDFILALADFASREKDLILIKKTISIILNVFNIWQTTNPNEESLLTIETPEGKEIETKYKVNNRSLEEFNLLVSAFELILENKEANVICIIIEELGEKIWKITFPYFNKDNHGVYAIFVWDFIRQWENSNDVIIRMACAKVATKFLLISPPEFVDFLDIVNRYLKDKNFNVRNQTLKTLEDVFIGDNIYDFTLNSERVDQINNEINNCSLNTKSSYKDVRNSLNKIRLHLENKVSKNEDFIKYIPSLTDSSEIKESKLDDLINYIDKVFKLSVKQKSQIINAITKYILSEQQLDLQEKAVEIIFKSFIIHSINVDEAFPPFMVHEDGSVTEQYVIHKDSSDEIENILKNCKILLQKGNDNIKYLILKLLGTCFGHEDFITSPGGKGCSSMVFNFMKNYLNSDNVSILKGLAEGSVKIYNVLLFIRNGPSYVILKLLENSDPAVHKHTAAMVLSFIEEKGKNSSIAKNIVIEVCSKVRKSSLYPKIVKEAFKDIDIESAEKMKSQFQEIDPDYLKNKILYHSEMMKYKENDAYYLKIIQDLQSPEEKVRLSSLNLIKDEKILSLVKHVIFLSKTTNSITERGECIRTLGLLNSYESIDYLLECLSDDNIFIIKNAIYALGNLKTYRCIPSLCNIATTSHDDVVIILCLKSLGEIYAFDLAHLFPIDFFDRLVKIASTSTLLLQQDIINFIELVHEKNQNNEFPDLSSEEVLPF